MPNLYLAHACPPPEVVLTAVTWAEAKPTVLALAIAALCVAAGIALAYADRYYSERTAAKRDTARKHYGMLRGRVR